MTRALKRRGGFIKLSKSRYIVKDRKELFWAVREFHFRTNPPAKYFSSIKPASEIDYPCVVELEMRVDAIALFVNVYPTKLDVYMKNQQQEMRLLVNATNQSTLKDHHGSRFYSSIYGSTCQIPYCWVSVHQ